MDAVLRNAHAADASTWPTRKEELLAYIETSLKQMGARDTNAIRKAKSDIGQTLEEVRKILENSFESQRIDIGRYIVDPMLKACGLGPPGGRGGPPPSPRPTR